MLYCMQVHASLNKLIFSGYGNFSSYSTSNTSLIYHIDDFKCTFQTLLIFRWLNYSYDTYAIFPILGTYASDSLIFCIFLLWHISATAVLTFVSALLTYTFIILNIPSILLESTLHLIFVIIFPHILYIVLSLSLLLLYLSINIVPLISLTILFFCLLYTSHQHTLLNSDFIVSSIRTFWNAMCLFQFCFC